MSGEAVTTTESATQTTQDIAASVIQDAEHQAADTQTQADVAPTPTVTPAEQRKLSEAEALLHEAGYQSEKKPDGREHWIPRSKVLKMIDSGLKKRQEALDQEYTPIKTEAEQLRQWHQTFVGKFRGDETQFLRDLAAEDPRYARFLEQKIEQVKEQQATDPRPEPDVDLGNGMKTYSPDGNDKLIEWKARQLIAAELGPWKEQQKQAKEQQDAAKAHAAITERVQSQAAEARSWPNFTEWEPEILKKLAADSDAAKAAGRRPTMTAREAYLEVKADYLAADDTAKRQRWLDEQNKAAKSTSVTRTGVEPTKQPGPRTTQDITRQVIADATKSIA